MHEPAPPPSRRSVRRHHKARKKTWVRRVLPHFFLGDREPPPRRVGMYADTPKPCSCWMCGNPRRYLNEPPIQERRAAPGIDEEWEG